MTYDGSKILVRRLAALLALAFSAALAACVAAPRSAEAPRVDLVALELVDEAGGAQRLRAGLAVTNPNDGRITIQRLSFSVRVAGGGVMSGRVPEPFSLDPDEVRSFQIELGTHLVSSTSRLLALVQGPESGVPYDLSGLVTLSRGLSPTHPFSARGEVPLSMRETMR